MGKNYKPYKQFNKPEEPKTEERVIGVDLAPGEDVSVVKEPETIRTEGEPYEVEEVVADGVIDTVGTSLNIRQEPKVVPNNQIAILGKGTKIIVVDPKETIKSDGEEWYKVRYNGDQGYAMKKYIKVL